MKTAKNMPKVNKSYVEYLGAASNNSMFLDPIDPQNVLDITRKIKPKHSSGHGNISAKLLKETIHIIKDPITHIINRSFETGIVPDQLKIAKVIPIYKSSDNTILNNYRPVSLLSSFSKIIEKIMYTKFLSFLNSKNILYKHQYGFREKHSTIHPLLHLLNHCAEANNKQPKEHTLAIYCDLSKVFDVINHKILLHKLIHYGLRGIVNKWFQNYLSNS